MNAIIVLCLTGILTLVAEITRIRKVILILGIAGIIGAIVSHQFTDIVAFPAMVSFDSTSLGFTYVILIVGALWLLFSSDYLHESAGVADKTALILFAITGTVIMVSFRNLSMLFLGIEILSISLYILAGTRSTSFASNEAAFKYFLMGSFATGIFLMGIALIYGATKSFDISLITEAVRRGNLPSFFYVGMVLTFVGMAFKMSLAPFHYWAPDVYEGSPTSITAFMATVVKVGAIGAFYRFFVIGLEPISSDWLILVKGSIYASLILANLSALSQRNIKRMLAYSSISHVGFILMALLNNNSASTGIILYYLAGYAAASLLGFSALIYLENRGEGTNTDAIAGLFNRNPFLAFALTLALLSMAGIPPLAGFFGKYLVIKEALSAGDYGIVSVAILASLVSIYYYFQNFVTMYTAPTTKPPFKLKLYEMLFLVLMTIVVLGLGAIPEFFLNR